MSKLNEEGNNMKFELDNYHRNTSDDELINDLKYVANLTRKTTITLEEYNEYGHLHVNTQIWFLV